MSKRKPGVSDPIVEEVDTNWTTGTGLMFDMVQGANRLSVEKKSETRSRFAIEKKRLL